ncbi:MAG: glycosyltransferase family 2 protein [Geobacter sp.]|nr:glycosyltransferase family 2 protein [Geobacter sp.]
MLLSIVIPAFNEVSTIQTIIERINAVELPFQKEIIVVDDCSSDGTRELLQSLENDGNMTLHLHFHERNMGKGAALRSGFSVARGDIVVIQDADLEYDPEEYAKLIKPILDGKADVVYGSRFSGSGPHRVLYFWHYVGNTFLTLLSNMLTNLNLTDMETCYKAFRKEVLTRVAIQENRFGFEPEITAKMAKLHCRIYEVGISYSGRSYREGKKINWKDGVAALWCILKYNLLPATACKEIQSAGAHSGEASCQSIQTNRMM